MKKPTLNMMSGVSISILIVSGQVMAADSISEAIEAGKASGDFRLRYESVEQDNAVDDATALTLRSRIGYSTGDIAGVSAMIEFEDSRIVANQNDFTVGPTGFNPGEYSVIADPETTEVDQGYLQYKNNIATVKLGRQVLTLDNHRFVGHVGWRQDRQTFDALSVVLTPVEKLTVTYAYLDQRNRIFAEAADINAQDHLFNIGYTTPFGKLTGYAYLLEVDQQADNALDTYGVSFKGSMDMSDTKFLYGAEYATQEKETEGVEDRDMDYMMLEGGVVISGVTIKANYEVLGSDDGKDAFFTPLATLHKFNGWADTFVLDTPDVGVVDMSVTVSGTVAGGKWAIVYHDFEADEPSDTVDDLGKEIDVLYAKKFGKYYNTGIKYAAYSNGDTGADTDKLWVWVGAAF